MRLFDIGSYRHSRTNQLPADLDSGDMARQPPDQFYNSNTKKKCPLLNVKWSLGVNLVQRLRLFHLPRRHIASFDIRPVAFDI